MGPQLWVWGVHAQLSLSFWESSSSAVCEAESHGLMTVPAICAQHQLRVNSIDAPVIAKPNKRLELSFSNPLAAEFRL